MQVLYHAELQQLQQAQNQAGGAGGLRGLGGGQRRGPITALLGSSKPVQSQMLPFHGGAQSSILHNTLSSASGGSGG